MMKYYILDDDVNVVKMLRNIIEKNFNRKVVGHNIYPVKAVHEVIVSQPDILLVDYLMPEMDGSDVVEKVKNALPNLEVIMISQVSDKAMVAIAYQQGVNMFISKPLNQIEIDAVLKQIEDKIETMRKLNQIVSLIGVPVQKSPHNQNAIIRSVLKGARIYYPS